MSEHTPLLDDNVSSIQHGDGEQGEEEDGRNKLGTLNGVFVPCSLNIVGVVMFESLGWGVGEAGWLGTLSIFLIGEVVCVLTVLSLSAIISNGEMKGGGAYYLLARTTGPELGGAIGILFYTAYSVGASFYIIGFAQAVQAVAFPTPPTGWSATELRLLIGSAGLLIVLGVSLLGAAGFTKINVPLFVVQFGAIVFGIVSMFVRPAIEKPLPHGGTFSGWSTELFMNNTMPEYNSRGCSGDVCSYHLVFAIIFPALCGIMEGANLSGDLANPQKSIWKGTLAAIGFSFVTYLFALAAFAGSFDRDTLTLNNFTMQDAAYWSPLILTGVLISTFSSALGAVFGGSRLLQAIARDRLFPGFHVFGKGSGVADEPRRAVLVTWVIAQACLFIGDLNVVAPIISSFFLLSYAMTNLACFLLSVSGTPNFRPRFRYFSSYSAFLGLVVCIGIMFYLNPLYAAVSLFVMALISLYLVIMPNPDTNSWGDVRQAIIFHQVRKYLLRLDQRHHHGKLWRPSVLLLSGRAYGPLPMLGNFLKKGGLYVLGFVLHNDARGNPNGKVWQSTLDASLQYIEKEKLKAFPQITYAPSTRDGFNSLMMTAGLGAMAPNTVVIDFLDEDDNNEQQPLPIQSHDDAELQKVDYLSTENLGRIRDAQEFVEILHDVVELRKNLVVPINFLLTGRDLALSLKDDSNCTIDIWLPSFQSIDDWSSFCGTSLLQVQLGYVLNQSKNGLELYRQIDAGDESVIAEERQKLVDVVKRQARFRIGSAGDQIHVVPSLLSESDSQDAATPFGGDKAGRQRSLSGSVAMQPVRAVPRDVDYWSQLNQLVLSRCTARTSMVILPLPPLPDKNAANNDEDDRAQVQHFVTLCRALTKDLPPTLLILAEETEFMSTNI